MLNPFSGKRNTAKEIDTVQRNRFAVVGWQNDLHLGPKKPGHSDYLSLSNVTVEPHVGNSAYTWEKVWQRPTVIEDASETLQLIDKSTYAVTWPTDDLMQSNWIPRN